MFLCTKWAHRVVPEISPVTLAIATWTVVAEMSTEALAPMALHGLNARAISTWHLSQIIIHSWRPLLRSPVIWCRYSPSVQVRPETWPDTKACPSAYLYMDNPAGIRAPISIAHLINFTQLRFTSPLGLFPRGVKDKELLAGGVGLDNSSINQNMACFYTCLEE